MAPFVTISGHTTASKPRPHILYSVKVNIEGKALNLQKRYSEFVALHAALDDPYSLPPKRLFATTFIPSAWVDDQLIAERKDGLTKYLSNLLSTSEYKTKHLLRDFLYAHAGGNDLQFDLEDALPSTLTRTQALKLASSTANGEVKTKATMIAASYYPDWVSSTNPPEGIDFSKFDILYFGRSFCVVPYHLTSSLRHQLAFATPSSSSTVTLDSTSQSILKRLVAAARSSGHGTKICLSIGGWGGCYYYSQSCSTSANRTKFANSIASAINTYGLDGVDFDWEYPNSPGAGQPYSSADSANFLSLLQLVRTTIGSSKIISGAVTQQPWLGSNGQPLANVSAYAAVMTFVNIMNYDVWGASSTPGPNAPLGNLCGTSTQPQASAEATFKQWTAAKFPASQLVLGMPLYGYASQSSKTVLSGSFAPSADMLLLQKIEEKQEDGTTVVSSFHNGAHANNVRPTSKSTQSGEGVHETAANLTSWWGQQIPFNAIVSSGALVKKSDGTYGQGGGFTMAWDNCSDTPYLYNTSQDTVVTYDDTWSLSDKASFAKSNGMAGCFTWSLDQDDGYTLWNSIRSAMGK
ncbi:glycoside hydrolase family 18 protein [Gymnopilus junonius]|uniref:Glycoside hydrolase family 18 protein n=1 Tax=Gymnopilus junonius TaxID=109634 RepID=A0A9P5NP10_GYMJU|nr:glycoside hydrolase family 18 protein [Gymnopilus junonius]